MNTKNFIYVTFQKEGIHCYPAAATDPKLADVKFLASEHRHIFHFKFYIEVEHNDRDLEFIQVKRQCEKWLGDGTLQLNHKSCEMIADDLWDLAHREWPGRDIIIDVSEDGENGCVMNYPYTRHLMVKMREKLEANDDIMDE